MPDRRRGMPGQTAGTVVRSAHPMIPAITAEDPRLGDPLPPGPYRRAVVRAAIAAGTPAPVLVPAHDSRAAALIWAAEEVRYLAHQIRACALPCAPIPLDLKLARLATELDRVSAVLDPEGVDQMPPAGGAALCSEGLLVASMVRLSLPIAGILLRLDGMSGPEVAMASETLRAALGLTLLVIGPAMEGGLGPFVENVLRETLTAARNPAWRRPVSVAVTAASRSGGLTGPASGRA